MLYLTLFASAFVAATLLPFSSEVLLGSLLLTDADVFLLWLSATAGNTLGAIVNWALGKYLLHFQDKAWFPFKEDKLAKAQAAFQRFGQWSLLFTWLPIIGDPLAFLAGTMNVRFPLFVVLVALGKGLRYGVIVFLVG